MKPTNPPRVTDVVVAVNAHGLALYATSDARLDAHGYVVAKRRMICNEVRASSTVREINYVLTGKTDWSL